MAKKDKGGKALTYKVVEKQAAPSERPRLHEKYKSDVIPELMKEFGYANAHQVPKLEKITVNMGLGKAVAFPNLIKSAEAELTMLTGQKAVVNRARKSIANFKLREGMPIGCSVTLRSEHMWEFLDRLCAIALPRVRDFKGINGKAFDGRGNYNLGLRDHTVFPEIQYDKVDEIKGMNISFATTAANDEEGKALLKNLGLPFRN